MSKDTISQMSSSDDTPYDPNDPEAVASFWEGAKITHRGKVVGTARRPGQRGPQKAPKKVQVTLRLSPEVLAFFKSKGKGWQVRLNNALKEYVELHQ